MNSHDQSELRVPYRLMGVFLVLAFGVITAGYVSFNNYQQSFRFEVESQLGAIAELKVGELDRWRKDRLEHGTIISRVETLSTLIRHAFAGGADTEARRQLHGWLVNYSDSFHYDQIRVLDVEGTTLMSLPAGRPPVSSAVKKQLAEVVRSKQVSMVDFYRNDHDKRVYMTMLIPIRSDLDNNRVLAVIALRVDPEKYIYPLIRFWPTSSQTAETLLVRREGNDALFLNELKFSRNSTLNLRASLNNINQPAVMAVQGKEGIVKGTDYRGANVVAYLHAVPGTPWFLVARVDTGEVYAPLKERLWWMVSAVTLLILCSGSALGLLWRQQRVLFYRRQYEIEQERSWLQGVIARSLNEIYVFDPLSLRHTFANNGALMNLGYSMEEITKLTAFDLMSENTENTEDRFREALQPLLDGKQERLVFETVHRRKDGSTYPVEVYLQLVDAADGAVFLAVVNDITVRKQADDEIRQKNAELERFTYTVSHDLKSPLITIKSFTGSIKRDFASGRSDRLEMDLQRIGTAADKMAALLDDLLELSRIGRIVNTSVPESMSELVDEVLKHLAGLLKSNSVTVDVQPGLPTVLCDRQRLAEVVQNLVENAVKYMGNQPEPRILFGMREECGKSVFFVQDNGIGIDQKYFQNIFGLFNKLDAKSDGTGIGLALVKRIVEVHGGLSLKVWVRGAGFVLRLWKGEVWLKDVYLPQ